MPALMRWSTVLLGVLLTLFSGCDRYGDDGLHPYNTPPSVIIRSPADGFTIEQGQAVTFRVTVGDSEDLPTNLKVEWTSSIDGTLYTTQEAAAGSCPDLGGDCTFARNDLSVGEHLISVRAFDTGAYSAYATVSLTVKEKSEPPTCQILAPEQDALFVEGQPVAFTGKVDDLNGDLVSLRTTWASDLDGTLITSSPDPNGNTGYTAERLSVGRHTITLYVKDPTDLVTYCTRFISVEPENRAPEVSISAPADGSVYRLGDPVRFAGVVEDDRDPAELLEVEWESDIDGIIDTNAADNSGNVTFTFAELSAGIHVITLRATDSAFQVAEDTRLVEVLAPNQVPTAAILSVEPDVEVLYGTNVIFTGSVTDPEDSSLLLAVTWTSSLDGELQGGSQPDGSGSVTLATAKLSPGIHTITLYVEDTEGLATSDSAQVVVKTPNEPPSAEISGPAEGTYIEGTPLLFVGKVGDVEDTSTNLTVEWISSVDGTLPGTPAPDDSGAVSFLYSALSAATHEITLRVTDLGGARASDKIVLTIRPPNQAPTAEITGPSVTTYPLGSTVIVTGLVADAEDDEQLLDVAISSDKDGQLCTGKLADAAGNVVCPAEDLREGTHLITLTVSDLDGAVATAILAITMESENRAPEILEFTSPRDNDSYSYGEAVPFRVKVNDPEDAEATLAVEWTSSIDGVFNTDPPDNGGNIVFTDAALNIGRHDITLKVTDSKGYYALANVIFDVEGVNTPPEGVITAPDDGVVVVKNSAMTFQAQVVDIDEDASELNIVWSSDRDGVLNTNSANSSGVAQFTTGVLSVGTHTVSLEVSDKKGASVVDSVVVTVREPNAAPGATIDDPTAEATFRQGQVVTFNGSVSDDETPPTSLTVVWSSDLEASPLSTASPDASGRLSFTTTSLSVGTHFVTLAVTDSDGAVSIDTVTFSVLAPNTPPTVDITAPTDGTTVEYGTNVVFRATAADVDESAQNLAAVWTDDASGALNAASPDASGSLVFSTAALAVGTHLVTVQVTDSAGGKALDTVTVVVRPVKLAPKVDLTSPSAITVIQGTSLTFAGTATDELDSPTSLSVKWLSSVDGSFNTSSPDGSGNLSFLYTGLTVGTHLITLEVTDSDGLMATDSVTIVVKPVNTPPTVSISAPVANSVTFEGDQVVFKGKVADANQAPTTLGLSWSSDLAGVLYNSPADSSGNTTFATSGLTAGTHLITLKVTDSDGGVAETSVSITVRKAPQPPVASISSPTAGTYVTGTTLTFAGKAIDAEDLETALTISWSSSLDGQFNTTRPDAGGNMSFLYSTLSLGTHLITLTVTDSDGMSATASTTVTIRNPNAQPTVTITAPTDGITTFSGQTLSFSATADDAETAKTLLKVQWSSDLDGNLSAAACNSSGVTQFSTSALKVGTHVITVTITDADSGVASDSITVKVRATNSAPTASISAPTSGITVFVGSTVTFQGKVNDADDAETALAIEWSSSQDGVLNTSGADAAGNVVFATSSLKVGTHTVTLKVTDTDGVFSTAVVILNVRALNSSPLLSISDPTDGDIYTQGQLVSFVATTSDAENAATLLDVEWRSDLNGIINTDPPNAAGGISFSKADLSVGTHLITLRVTDLDGAVSTDQVSITVVGPNQPPTINITAPADNVVVFSGASVSFKAKVADLEDLETALSVEFESSITGAVFASPNPDAGGNVAFNFSSLPVGIHLITARVTDTDGAVASDSITLTVRLPNANPTAVITNPLNGASVFQGATVVFTGKVSDAEDLPSTLTTSWKSSKDGVLGASSPDGSGVVTFSTNALSVGTHVITLTVTDTEGLSGTATLSLTIRGPNQSPAVSITAPSDSSVYTQGNSITFKGKLSDPEDSPTVLAVEWRSSRDGVLDTGGADTGGNVTFATSSLSVGTHLITLKATDLDGAATSASISVVVKPPNVAPSVTITGPSVTTYDAGASVTLAATASDAESAANLLSYVVTSNVQGTLASGSVSSGGGISFTTTGLSVGVHTITVKVTDPDGGVGTDDIVITVNALNTAPTADITQPVSGATANLGAAVLFKATATDAEDLETALTYSFSSSIGGTFQSGNPDAAGNISFSYSSLAQGSHTITLTVTDTKGAVATDTTTITIIKPNTPPTVVITAPTTFTYEQGESITFSATAGDAEDPKASLTAKWTSDKVGVINSGACNSSGITTFSTTTLSVATHLITVTITDTGGLTASASITVTVVPPNTAPSVNITSPASGASFNQGVAVLLKGTGIDAEDAETALTWKFVSSKDGQIGTGAPDAAGNISLTTSSLSVGNHTLTLTVTDTKGLAGSDTITLIIKVPNAAPSVSITKPTTTTFETGESITFEGVANDPEDAENLLTATWSSDKDGVLNVASCDIAGKTTFSKALTAIGTHVITLSVQDTAGAIGTTTMSITVTTANTPPVVTISTPSNGALLNSGQAVLFAGTAIDAESAETSLTVVWTSDLDGTLNSTPPDSSGNVGFSTSALSIGTHAITLKATDPGGQFGTVTISITVKIANRAPTPAPAIAIGPTSPRTADDLVVSIVTPSVDPDGDTVSYKYQWYKNTVLIPGLNNSSVGAALTTRGDVWKVRVTPTDGALDGPFAEVQVTILNTAPSIASVSISPTTAFENTVLTVSISGFTDADGDSPVNTIEWYVGASKVLTGPSTLSGTYFNHGDSVTAKVTPGDGTDTGSPLTSNAVLIKNTAPTAPVVDLTPEDPNLTEVLVCKVTTVSTDIDGDPITYLYQFFANGVEYVPATQSSNSTSASLSGSVPKLGERWTCKVTPDDSDLSGPLGQDFEDVLPDVGDLVVTEAMIYPNGTESLREWVEIKNTTTWDIPVDGFVLTDDGANSHTISSGGLKVQAGKYIVLGAKSDTAVNGGVTVPYEYSNFSMINTTDKIIIRYKVVANSIDRLIDSVNYAAPPFPVIKGRSMSLDPGSTSAGANDTATNWCGATSTRLSGGDLASPGVANEACACATSDGDVDGFGDASASCSVLDCNDASNSIFPGATETCGDSIDQDCSGSDLPCTCGSTDLDGDGYGTSVTCPQIDCNDGDSNINPGATEATCNGKDDDCDGMADDHPDADNDTYDICGPGVTGADAKAIDCNDAQPLMNPGTTEVCDDYDNNCNGTLNEGSDVDGDLYYTCAITGKAADCLDSVSSVNPGATEICDAYDNDCDSLLNELSADSYEGGTDNNVYSRAYTWPSNLNNQSTTITTATIHNNLDGSDFYRFNTIVDDLPTGDAVNPFTLTVQLTSLPAGTNYDLYLYRAPGTTAIKSSTNTGTTAETVTVPATSGDDSGDYLIEVRRNTGQTNNFSCTPYTLSFSNGG